MTRQRLQAVLALGVSFIVAAVVIGLFAPDGNSDKKVASLSPTTSVVGDMCVKADVISGILVSAGFTPDEFTIGESFDLTLPAAVDAGNGRFADQPLTTKDALMSFLKSGTPAAQALLDTTVALSGGTKEQASDPSNWEGFQLLTESEWSGNTLYVDGKVTPAGIRHSAKGDIGWVFINPDDCSTKANVVRVAIVRLACGNPQATAPNPPGEPAPPPTPTTIPPSTTTSTTVPSTTTSTTVCSSGKCTPPTTVAPPPTTTPPPTTAPPNNGGQGDSGDGATNTTSPPTTQAPAPAPPTTTSPTTNPPPPAG